jgi:ATP citrate (pro-S)-lyase
LLLQWADATLQLILNVDGCIAVCFVDLLRDSGAFTPEEADEYIKVNYFVLSLPNAQLTLSTQIGTLNGLFVLGRSIGFIGHHLDQKRLRAPLYRHPADDIFINMADISQPRVLGKMQ